VERYAVCYSKVTPDEAKDFELLILDPDHYTANEIGELKKSGTILIAYLNIAEFESYRGYSIPESLIIGKNPEWEGHFYVDVTSNVWQSLIFDQVIPKIISKNFDGFFIDMVDIVQVFPHFYAWVIDIVRTIKLQNKEKILIANNGWILMDTLKNYVDAFLIEGLFTSYNFQSKRYFVRFEKEYADRVKILKSLGKKIFTLDFLPEHDKRRNFVKNLSKYYGFTPYVSTIELNKLHR
ncbi:MAG: endo alpha-1,4 polygalactosaminidase, partial [Candidatus Kryptonium sp.]